MRRKYVYIILVLVAITGIGIYLFCTKNSPQMALPDGVQNVVEFVPAPTDLSEVYEDTTYLFRFRYPKEYTMTSPSSDNLKTLVFHDNEGNGFQIIVTDFDEPSSSLTVERVRRDIPDLKIDAVQPVVIGNEGQGIAFISDNDEFGGASREVWFVFRGHLFQISTYLKNDPLLKAVLETWQLGSR